MTKTILITGATDGIGFETAKTLVQKGHKVLLHGRNSNKLKEVSLKLSKNNQVESFLADLSDLKAVRQLALDVKKKYQSLDVLINNAGVLQTPNPITKDGYDLRFIVNTVAPYLLTKELAPLFNKSGRIINLSSAAQKSVNLKLLVGVEKENDPMSVYSQSKLAIAMWSRHIASEKKNDHNNPLVFSVNPGSLLGSKMVKEGFGIVGKSLQIGADILVEATLSDRFLDASGKYFDNDLDRFSDSHQDLLDQKKCQELVDTVESIINSRNNKT